MLDLKKEFYVTDNHFKIIIYGTYKYMKYGTVHSTGTGTNINRLLCNYFQIIRHVRYGTAYNQILYIMPVLH